MPDYITTVKHYVEERNKGAALLVEHDETTAVKMLDARPIGPDIQYSYLTIARTAKTPPAKRVRREL